MFFKRKLVVVDADLEALARVMCVLKTEARRNGMSESLIEVQTVLEYDPGTFQLKPMIDRFYILVPRGLYRKVVDKVEKQDVFQKIVDGEYEG